MKEKSDRVFVLGIDGFPYSLLQRLINKGKFKNVSEIISKSSIKKMKSVYPVVSSVAWTSFATGTNPGQHGIFGFVDRRENPFTITIPMSTNRQEQTIWSRLSQKNIKSIVINVPVTYPVEPIFGKMISCFLCPDIKKGVYPQSLYNCLKKNNYIIDVDSWIVRTNKEAFLSELINALDARCKVALELGDDWRYYQLHIMETDRLFHFFWNDIENTKSCYHEMINNFFDRLDMWIGKIADMLEETDCLIILSDHGFCGIKKEVQLNKWLIDKGYLIIDSNKKDISSYKKESICYSLLPGRIYINLKGREEKGTVSIEDYDEIRKRIKSELLNWRDPENNSLIIKNVFFREEIYAGQYLKDAADIIAYPNEGYDLKGTIDSHSIFTHSELSGMHTYDDALIIGKNISIEKVDSIQDVYKEIIGKY